MAKCERPTWTVCFILVWILVVPGALLTHLALDRLRTPIQDLPSNVATGLDETFRFAYLELDAANVKNASSQALVKCNVNASAICPSGNYPAFSAFSLIDVNTSRELAQVNESFANSLSVVNKIANDIYFGVDSLQPTANRLNEIVGEMNRINSTMKCGVAVPIWCKIHESSGGIVAGIGQVNDQIHKFKNSDVVQEWEKHGDKFVFVHCMPYVMVVALLFFTCFWLKGGVCWCCKGGTIATLVLIPYVVFWAVSFIIYAIICVAGFVVKYMADTVPVPVLRNKPNLEQAIAHLQTNYSEFWDPVFGSMVDGLDKLFFASWFFVAVGVLIMMYSVLECCCCPYRKAREEDGEFKV